MTINIALVTSEALVLGCDSIASATTYLVDPFACKDEVPADPTATDNGQFVIRVTSDDIVQHVTNTWDGVTKMFALHGGTLPVAATTAGLARLCSRSMSSFANEFFDMYTHDPPGGALALVLYPGTAKAAPDPPLNTVKDVAERFLAFMRGHYEKHYQDSKLPPEYHDGPIFLVGGYDRNEQLPSLYRVSVQSNAVGAEYEAGKFGVAWEGQSDAVERLIRGYDTVLRARIEAAIGSALEGARAAYSEATAQIVQGILDKLGQNLPDGFAMELPESPKVKLPWSNFATPILLGNLPVQDAVNLTAYLVGLQSGKARFAYGVPTVGGRTHVGVITKANAFKMLDEPELKHTNVGFL